ncbi:MAG: DUF6094 domain-containing protein [Aggregatilineales bacterium]
MRRAGVEKLGYFPIPLAMMGWIAAQLRVEGGATVPIIDPCMGEGAALKLLADQLHTHGAKPVIFGCEISRSRHATAVQSLLNDKREGISRLLHGPAEFIETSRGAFSVLYLNPPFDEHGREQNRWLEMTRDWLTPGGWLVFITTEESALRADTQEMLNRSYERVVCYRYPEAERKFNEVVVFGQRRSSDLPYHQRRAILYTAAKLTTLTLAEQFNFAVPASAPPKRFSMVIPDVEDSMAALRRTGLSAGEQWKRTTQAASLQSRWQPLLELSDGHIANLISSGVFDGLAIQDAELGRCLITGYSTKEKGKPVVEVSEDGSTQTQTVSEIPVVHLVVMDVDSGDVHEFSSRTPEDMERFILRHIDTLKQAIMDTLKPAFDVDTMLGDYLPYVPNFKAPGVLPGATRIRTAAGTKLRVLQKAGDGYICADEQGESASITKADVAHVYQNMLPAQVIKAAAMAYALKHTTTSVIEIGQMGCGKTSTSSLTLYLYLAKQIEQAAGSLADSVRELGELEATLQAATATADSPRIHRLEARRTQLEKRIQARFKIVVVCPGHLVNKWAREATTNFSHIQVGGQPVQVVIPGRVPRRRTAYDVIGANVVCAACGTPASVRLSHEDKLKRVTLTDKLDRLKSLKCSNPKCGDALIETVEDCAIEDIDETFAAPGLSVIILSKEAAKLGASWEPALIRRTLHVRDSKTGKLILEERAQCPSCGGYVQNKAGDYLHPDDLTGKRLFCKHVVERPKRENGKVVMLRQPVYEWRGTQYGAAKLPQGIEPHHLVKVEREVPVMEKAPCGTPLFSFTRLGSTGKRSKANSKPRNSFGQWVNGTKHPNHGSARWELAKVIARRHRGEYMLIIDECHQYKAADSTQGKAIQWLITSAQRTIALTGTIFGGKASSLFYLLYRLSAQFREAFSFRSVEYFIDQFGVRDYVTKVTQTDDDGTPTAYGAHVRESTRIDEGNGVDPSIVRWLLSIGVFLTLDDLGIALPEKEERFHWVTPEPELNQGLYALQKIQKEASLRAAKGDMSMFSAWMQAALGWPLCPDQAETYLHPDHRKVMEKMLEAGRVDDAKDYEAMHTSVWAKAVPFSEDRPEGEIVRQIADACRRDWERDGDLSVVYVSGIKRPANKHLYQAMKRRGLRPFILSTPGDVEVVKWCDPADFARCELEQRETVIADALEQKDIQVLIVNPPLVATGLDLVAFNRLHFCGLPTYSVYTFEQSMCRLHRPGQQKRVTIDFWVYGTDPTLGNNGQNQLQALGMSVMSDKVRASAVVSGSVGAGLAALNQQSSDIMTTLRDLLLSDNADAALAAPASNDEAAVAMPKPRVVDARYAWIEAEIERYDDLRKPLVVAAPLPETQILPEPTISTIPELPIWSLAEAVPLGLRTEGIAVDTAEPEVALALSSPEAKPITTADDGEAVPDTLAALAAELGTTVRISPNTPFLLSPVRPTPSKPAQKRRRRKIDLSRAPADGPLIALDSPCPELPSTAPIRVRPGLQIPLL